MLYIQNAKETGYIDIDWHGDLASTHVMVIMSISAACHHTTHVSAGGVASHLFSVFMTMSPTHERHKLMRLPRKERHECPLSAR